MSREAAAFLAFAFLGAVAAGAAVLEGLAGDAGSRAAAVLLALTTAAGLTGIASSAGIYRIPARPAWDTWRTPAQFFLTVLFLGGSGSLTAALAVHLTSGLPIEPAAVWCCGIAALGAAACQAFIPWTLVASGLASEESPLRGAALLLTRQLGRVFWSRTLLLGASAASTLAALLQQEPGTSLALSACALAAGLGAEVAGRYLFFVTVVPRNMPGHFFSRNSPLDH